MIPGSGGLRKLRWKIEGCGKRGGLRVIYYWHRAPGMVVLLELYRKNERADLSPGERRELRRMLDAVLKEIKS